MYRETHVSLNKRRALRRRRAGRKFAALLLALCAVFAVMAGGTIAYLIAKSDAVTNTFKPAHVTCEVTETFENNKKTDVNVKNTSDIPAYLRVKLITYRVNEKGDRIGGTATVPTFTPGEGWVKYPKTGDDFYYYYTKPVAPADPNATPPVTGQPENPLIGSDGITLTEYTDADGGRQVVEVMAEAIQSVPPEAVGEAWGVKITPPEGNNPGKVEEYTAGGGGE